jgi:crotonobetainyl-CoA:carnitine CoA-transferase CaiB-like acyl-CoA transferase
MGAEVIRIENVGGAEDRTQGPLAPNGDNLRYLMLGRNKKGITLDLDGQKGRALFRRLVEKSDVLVENYSPPVKQKLGLTYEALKSIRSDIILVTISAFGTDGPHHHRLGFDHIIQAETGAMSFMGFPDAPPVRAQIPWVDLSTAVHSALGVAFALMHRNKTGEGQWIETALIDTAVSYLSFQGVAAEYQVLGLQRPQLGNAGYYSFSDTFAARDGMVMIALISDPLWRRLANLIGRPDLADDPRFAGDTARYQHCHVLNEVLQEWIGQRTVAEVMDAMEGARVPCGRVNDISQMVAHEQVAGRKLYECLEVPGLGHVAHPRVAIRMSRTPGKVETPAPRVGEHNKEVYCDLLGLSEQEFASLRAEQVV